MEECIAMQTAQCRLLIPSYPMIRTSRGMHPCDVFASVIDRDVFSFCADSTYDNMIVQRGASTCGSVRPFSGAEIACWLGLNLIAAQSSEVSIKVIRKTMASADPKLCLTTRRYEMIEKYFTVDILQCWEDRLSTWKAG